MENPFEDPTNWQILFSETMKKYQNCICGHRVKRISYLYHKPTKTIRQLGKTCVAKYGIKSRVSNRILLDVIKDYTQGGFIKDYPVQGFIQGGNDLADAVVDYITKKYNGFVDKIKETEEGGEIDYYDVVAPFHRLLSDVCDLVAEYEFDLVDILKNIEADVEAMNQTVRHTMVDEYDSSMESLSDIASEDDASSSQEVLIYPEEYCQPTDENISLFEPLSGAIPDDNSQEGSTESHRGFPLTVAYKEEYIEGGENIFLCDNSQEGSQQSQEKEGFTKGHTEEYIEGGENISLCDNSQEGSQQSQEKESSAECHKEEYIEGDENISLCDNSQEGSQQSQEKAIPVEGHKEEYIEGGDNISLCEPLSGAIPDDNLQEGSQQSQEDSTEGHTEKYVEDSTERESIFYRKPYMGPLEGPSMAIPDKPYMDPLGGPSNEAIPDKPPALGHTEECSSIEREFLFENGPEKCGALHHCYCWIKYNLWIINKDARKQSESIEKLIRETREIIEESRLQREKAMETCL